MIVRARFGACCSFACAMWLVGCNDDHTVNSADSSSPHVATAAVTAPADEAKQLAQVRCAMCHGLSGKGDGPTSGTLNPKPRDFSSKEWQKSISDAELHTAILKGGPGVGKSPLMPANPDLESKPAVVDELVKIVRAYAN